MRTHTGGVTTGDIPMNMPLNIWALMAYMLDGEPAYKEWLLEKRRRPYERLLKLQKRVQVTPGWNRPTHRETEDLELPIVEKPVA